MLNTIINGINLLIKGANLFGASIKPIGQIGEVSFGRVGVAAQQTKQLCLKRSNTIFFLTGRFNITKLSQSVPVGESKIRLS